MLSPLTNANEKLLGQYLYLADTELNLLSVFDDLYYDRSDADLLTPGMRRHVAQQLQALGFKQETGTLFQHQTSAARCLIPKTHALGASPFDITRYTPRSQGDYYILTPTQTACQFIDHYPLEQAVEKTKTLIARQPINLYRLMDYLEPKSGHQDFLQAIGHLRYVQRKAVESEPLCYRRALG